MHTAYTYVCVWVCVPTTLKGPFLWVAGGWAALYSRAPARWHGMLDSCCVCVCVCGCTHSKIPTSHMMLAGIITHKHTHTNYIYPVNGQWRWFGSGSLSFLRFCFLNKILFSHYFARTVVPWSPRTGGGGLWDRRGICDHVHVHSQCDLWLLRYIWFDFQWYNNGNRDTIKWCYN